MRKRNCNNLFDNIMWYALYLLPILVYLQYVHGNAQTQVAIKSLDVFMSTIGLNVWTGNPISTALNSIFGSGGIMPFISEQWIFNYMAYFILVYMCHLLVDFILFIPRLAHKWLKKSYQEE